MNRLIDVGPKVVGRMIPFLILAVAVLAALGLFFIRALKSPEDCLCCYTLAGTGSPGPVLARTDLEPDFAWTPDGQQILYHDSAGQIFAVKLSSGEKNGSNRVGELQGFQPSLSSDGRYLALSTEAGFVEVYELSTKSLILAIPDAFSPQWSSERVLVIGVWQKNEIRIQLVRVNEPDKRVSIVRDPDHNYYPVSWSPDSSTLAVEESGVIDKDLQGLATKFYLLNVESGKVRPVADPGGCQRGLSWRPDGQSVVYSANPRLSDWDLYAGETAEGQPRQLLDTPDSDEYQPSWSPDGRYLAYVGFRLTDEGAPEQELYIVEVDIGISRQLTETPGIHESLPRWSPQGDKIAYLSFEDEVWFLNLMSSDGSEQVKLATIGPKG